MAAKDKGVPKGRLVDVPGPTKALRAGGEAGWTLHWTQCPLGGGAFRNKQKALSLWGNAAVWEHPCSESSDVRACGIRFYGHIEPQQKPQQEWIPVSPADILVSECQASDPIPWGARTVIHRGGSGRPQEGCTGLAVDMITQRSNNPSMGRK